MAKHPRPSIATLRLLTSEHPFMAQMIEELKRDKTKRAPIAFIHQAVHIIEAETNAIDTIGLSTVRSDPRIFDARIRDRLLQIAVTACRAAIDLKFEGD